MMLILRKNWSVVAQSGSVSENEKIMKTDRNTKLEFKYIKTASPTVSRTGSLV